MLADLFTDSTNDSNNQNKLLSSISSKPPSKRNSINLSGIINQGATCYLNTLIQTLFLTKEFRENLFSLKPDELGLIPNQNNQIKQRVILIELQRLFAQLLYLDQEACSTARLTESFGWSNNEELQQHDVQELNRILFNAIEQSLVNTSKSKLIQELYRGTCVNKIKCLSCQNIFEREEEFFDLPITVQGVFGLEMALETSFQMRESLNGNNQYKCEKCNNVYRDAEKYCQLKTLPPILTFSLLRFTYDLKTFQRIKETSCFEFPFEIDLKNYLEEKTFSNECTKYELFSIIIHSGNAYGGHYHTYIRDFDQLGCWDIKPKQTETKSESPKEICLICTDDQEKTEFNENSNEIVNLDYIKYETPLELLKAFIYNKNKYESIKIETICTDLIKITGFSWNKRFKNKYGPIEKFLKKYDNVFELLNDNKFVKLKPHDRINIISSSQYSNQTQLIESCLNEQNQVTEITVNEEDKYSKYHWFDFDDSKVTPIGDSQIRKQFEGKESAYMLFYRRKQTSEMNLSREQHLNKIPNWLVDEINIENEQLTLKRDEFEKKINSFTLECYLDNDFYIDQNVLNLNQQFENKEFKLEVDRRNSCVEDLKEILINYCTNNSPNENKEIQLRKEICLNTLLDEEKQFYWLLCARVDTSTSLSSNGRFSYFIKSLLTDQTQNLFEIINLNSKSKVILILSKHCDIWPIGDDYEPIRLVIKFDKVDISYTFTKCSLIKQIKETISNDYITNLSQIESVDEIKFKLIKIKPNKNDDIIELELTNEYNDKSLNELYVKNGDCIHLNIPSLEDNNIKIPISSETTDFQTYDIIVLNCLSRTLSLDEATFKLRVLGSDTINDLKIMTFSSFNLNQFNSDECQLRFMEDIDLNTFIQLNYKLFEGNQLNCAYCGISLHDDMNLNEVLNTYLSKNNTEKDVVLLLSPGRAPLKSLNEIAIKCIQEASLCLSTNKLDLDENLYEIIINLNETRISDLTNKLCDKIGLSKLKANDTETYYLKTVDWFGDAESVLNNVELICSEVPFKHNDHVLLVKGRLVPINHLKIKLWMRSSNSLGLQLENTSINEDDRAMLNIILDKKYQDFKLVEELIVRNDLKLECLKHLIQKKIIEKENLSVDSNLNEINLPIRLRLIKKIPVDLNEQVKFQMKKCLIDFHKPLKQLHLVQENDLYVELLSEEDSLINQGITLIDCVKIDIKTKLCLKNSFKTIMWNTNNGATLNSLKESILKAYSNELEISDLFKMTLAKYNYNKYQWTLLKDLNNKDSNSSSNNISGSKKNKKTKKTNQQDQQQQTNKSNLKSSPFYLDDGDLIAFSLDKPDDNSELNASHFMSEVDLDYNRKKNLTAAEISRIRKEKKNENNYLGLGNHALKSNRRPEVGISIKIDDFNS